MTGLACLNTIYLHADCDKKIAQLADDARANFARADLRDEEMTRLKAKYDAAIELADYQAAKLGDFVEVIRVCVHDANLDDAMPTLKWGILLKNRSMFRITLDGDVGSLFFEDQRLTAEKEIISNELQGLWPDREGSISFTQRLTDAEAGLIRRVPNGKFQFDKLRIRVKGGPGADHVKSSGVLIFPEFRTKLGKCSDKETQSTEPLQARIDELTLQKHGIRFEIDPDVTQVHTSGGGEESRRVQVNVQLRCTKIADSKLAIRGFSAALFESGKNGDVEIARHSSVVVYTYPEMKKIETKDGWTIEEPLTSYRWYMFFLDVEKKTFSLLTPRDHFFRVTMDAVGQEPQHIDFFVDSWSDVIQSNSSITLRANRA